MPDGRLLKILTWTNNTNNFASTTTTQSTHTIIKTIYMSEGDDQQTWLYNKNLPTLIIYPTISPESIVIPIISCILGFPILALFVICCLRRRAKLAREHDRRRNYDLQNHSISLVRFSPIHRLTQHSTKAIRLRSERSLSRGFPSLELDTVLEERSDSDMNQLFSMENSTKNLKLPQSQYLVSSSS